MSYINTIATIERLNNIQQNVIVDSIMQKNDNITTIQINKDTRDELKKLGSKGETYDEIIKKLLRNSKQKKK